VHLPFRAVCRTKIAPQKIVMRTNTPNSQSFHTVAHVQLLEHLTGSAIVRGVRGIVYVTAALVITQYIGTALFFLPIVVGQIAASTLIDVLGE
jgi:uncharacterized membrane protein YdcZ (DUF606 family)